MKKLKNPTSGMSLFSGCNFICLNLSSTSDTKNISKQFSDILLYSLFYSSLFRQICSEGRETEETKAEKQKSKTEEWRKLQ